MLARRILSLTFCLMLGGCSISENPLTGSGSMREILRTASGYVIEGTKQAAATIELGKIGVEKAKSAAGDFQQRAGDLQKRAENFQEGVESVKKGKELMEKAVAK